MYTLKIIHDECPQNPRDDRDCLPTLFTFWYRNYGNNKYWKSIEELIKTKNLTSKKSKLLKAMDIENNKEWKEWISDSTERALWYFIEQVEDVATLFEVLNIIGYKTHYWTSKWYSQGDSVDCILVADEDYINQWIKDIEVALESSSKLFDA